QQILAALTPSNIQTVIVHIESYGLPCQQYVYDREFLLRYADHCITPFEMDILSPRQEACPCPPADLIFHRRYELWRARVSPRMENFFGSVSGKWKYDFGLKLNLEGYLPYNCFYEV